MKLIISSVKQYAVLILCGIFICASLSSCTAGPSVTTTPVVTIEDRSVPLSGGTKVLKPESPGDITYSGGAATIDASNASEGYITAKFGGGGKIKLRVTKGGGTTYTYDLSSDGKYQVFPLTAGDGNYKVEVFKNVSGTQYSQLLSQNVSVKLRDSKLPFLYPSQYVNFDADSTTVAKGQDLANGATGDLEIVSNIYNYIIGNISYDTAKAQAASSGQLTGYLPVVDKILASKKGICFDYAAVMAAMLRSQQIPTRLEVGYVSNGAYHAWISTYIKEVGWVNNIIQFDGKSWKLMDPTFASSGGSSSSVMQYIGNGSNYRTQYIY